MTTPDDPFRDVLADAARAHFVVRTSKVLRAGTVSPGTLYRELGRARWQRTETGVWEPPGAPFNPLRRLTAVTHTAGDRALVTGQAALWLRAVVDNAPACPSLLVDLHDRVRPRTARVIATSRFDSVHASRVRGMRVAATPRALADYATEGATVDQLVTAIVAAVRLRRCTLEDLAAEVERRQRFRGRGRLRRALGLLRGELSHSGVEQRARRRLRQLDAAFTTAPHTVYRQEQPAAEIDIAHPPLSYGVEVDGPVHLWPERRAADAQHDRELGRDGWVIDRYWWDEIEGDLQRVAGEVAQRLEELRAGRRPGAGRHAGGER